MDWTRFDVGGVTAGWVTGGGNGLVLLLHGGPGMSDYTELMAPEVASALPGHRLARYQQRGMAPSTLDGPLTVAQLVDDLFGVADHLSADDVLLVGHSWGGHLAMHAAAAHPERVAGVALVDTLGAVGDGGQGTMHGIIGARIGEQALAELSAPPDPALTMGEAAFAQLRLMWPGYFADPAAAPACPPIAIDPVCSQAIMADANALLAAGALEAALPQVDVPVVQLIGRASPIDPGNQRATATLFKDVTVIELDTGHFPWIEQPGSLTEALRSLSARL